MRRANIFLHDKHAGILIESDKGYLFQYTEEYISGGNIDPVSLTLPIKKEPYESNYLFPFFDGLIPEGWLLNITQENWKIDSRDRMGLLLLCCKECIGAVSVVENPQKDG